MSTPAFIVALDLYHKWDTFQTANQNRWHMRTVMAFSILLVDDHPVVRCGIKEYLQNLNATFYEASNGVEALHLLCSHPTIDLVILDTRMPIMDGIDTAHEIRIKFPIVRILVHSEYENHDLINQLITLGIKGFHCKKDPLLALAVESVMKGQSYISPELIPLVKDQNSTTVLKPIQFSTTEKRILELCAVGFTTSCIGKKLGLKTTSIETYRKRLIKRFNANNITEVVDFAHRIGKL